MKAIVGTLVVIGTLLAGYLPHGSLGVLIQPLEVVIICGGALGAYIIANPGWVVKAGFSGGLGLLKPSPFNKELHTELLGLMFKLFNKARREGLMSIEADVEDPHSSELFNSAPKVAADHHAVDFICDYLRLMISGASNPYQLEDLMIVEIDSHHHESLMPSAAIGKVAESLPAFGIVAAVLGIVITMSYLDAGPLEIAHHMSVALVGTFLGILVAYGFVAPISSELANRAESESAFYNVIKTCLMANLNGYAPQVAVEFGRKAIPSKARPSFQELDEFIQSIK
ncbi:MULTISPECIES: flagellar motor stator protein MotA [Thiomicrorhabdus]|uniref:Flagellar motor stator protein MotA n=1 Tax=Thiomicrorhabdus heinhorstiae TaxID=2748010 RepID=A0ABS0BYA3_9GAMM|nr:MULTISPECIES: flagellar motor stator protein MotA [Thiomicrorhabdus]MBF6058374.1 flagellar motor stator protein MotA [Thiomicrorhabdus heinhorstiae]